MEIQFCESILKKQMKVVNSKGNSRFITMFKDMNTKKKSRLYSVLILLSLLLSALTFTPLVMPYGKHLPSLLHLPYTLWTGMLVSILFVCLTWLAVRWHPGRKEEKS